MRNLLLAVMLIAVLTQSSNGTKAAWGFGSPSSFSYYTIDQCTAQARICHPEGAKGPKDMNMDACMNVCNDCKEHFSALDQAVAGGQSGAVAGLCQKGTRQHSHSYFSSQVVRQTLRQGGPCLHDVDPENHRHQTPLAQDSFREKAVRPLLQPVQIRVRGALGDDAAP